MKSFYPVALCFLLCNTFSFTVLSQGTHFCGSDAARQQLLQEFPEMLQHEADLEAFTKSFIEEQRNGQNSRSGPYVIPIVFHIIHQGGPENISDAQVIDQVRIINEDFNKRNPDTSLVIPIFRPIIGDAQIEFRLANIDPWGNCTNGIERIHSSQTYVGNDYSKLNGWPREKYLNVWVVRNMRSGAAGYSYYPGSMEAVYSVPARDGVIILADYIGSIGNSNYTNGKARALSHEIGHYLNLKHVWGDTNQPGVACGDDDVDDTPVTRGSTSCNLNLKYCNPQVIENVQNHMDYSYCTRMFTEGQAQRMQAALNSDKADRNNLHTAANLAATGTDGTPTPCAPKAAFSANKRYVCLGKPVTLLDASYNGEITDYYWEFPNGVPAYSIDKNPTVTFQTPGWQPVKLTVSNAQGTSTAVDTFMVFVASDVASFVAPYHEDFEDPNVFNEFGWTYMNYDGNETYFKRVDFASHWGNACAQLNNYQSHADRDIDELISPGFDLSGLANADLKLSFYYSLASWNSNFSNLADSISVLVTSNCGTTNWISVYKRGGSNFVNAGLQEGYFIPTQEQAFWRYVDITLPSNWKQPNVRFKFQVFSAVKGNNFYIDDINIGNMLISGVEEPAQLNAVSVFPNPASDKVSIELNLAETTDVSIGISDMTGKEVLRIFQGSMEDGITRTDVTTSSLAKGVYLVNVKAGNSVSRKKLIIQ
ncbi:MAG: T9SS type A sorting domain-containing protein [Chitinophagales bacterium]|nr:T9SS type A sorting domain-containing protein [Chitinophagales bacterium]